MYIFRILLPVMINIESVFLFIGYMNALWQPDRTAMHAVIYIHSAFYIYGSKVGVHCRSTLFADLNMEITTNIYWRKDKQNHQETKKHINMQTNEKIVNQSAKR